MEFKLIEKPNMDALGEVLMSNWLRNADSSTDEGDCVKGYYMYWQACKRGRGKVEITYKQRLYNGVPYGRFYPECGQMKSCTYQWSAARSAMFRDDETDIDIVNCHPTILDHICQTNGISAPQLAEYVKNRDKFINNLNISKDEINTFNNITHSDWTQKSAGKFVFTALLYGASMKKIQECLHLSHTPIKTGGCSALLYKEIQALKKSVVGLPCYAKLVSDITTELNKNKETVHDGRLLSFILQEAERDVVQRAIAFFNYGEFNSSPVTAYIYDGFQIRCKDTAYIQGLLDELNEGSYLKFIMKPFPTPIQDLSFPQEARSVEQCMEDWDNLSTINVEGFYTAKERAGKPPTIDPDILSAETDKEAAELFLTHHGTTFYKADEAGEYCYILDEYQHKWKSGRGALLGQIAKLGIKKREYNKLKCDYDYLPYSENTSGAKNIETMVVALAPVNEDFIRDTNNSIKDYLFYNDFIFSFKDKKFYTYDQLNLRPFIIIDMNIGDKLMEMDDPRVLLLKQKIFCCFQNEQEITCFLSCIARALSGHYEDKVWYIFNGLRNSGKGTVEYVLARSFMGYVTTTNLPVAKSSQSGDTGADNRPVVTNNLHIARLAIANESKTTKGKPSLIDGNYIKGVVASGGDKINARIMRGNEMRVVPNAISMHNLNQVNECDPPNAMETCKVFTTNFSFKTVSKDDPDSKIYKVNDSGIKDWIRLTDWVPLAMLSLLAHHWSTTSASLIEVPDSFQQERDELIVDSSDLKTILNKSFDRVPTSFVPRETVQAYLKPTGLTSNKITRTLEALGMSLVQRTVNNKPKVYCYLGLSLKIESDKPTEAEMLEQMVATRLKVLKNPVDDLPEVLYTECTLCKTKYTEPNPYEICESCAK